MLSQLAKPTKARAYPSMLAALDDNFLFLIGGCSVDSHSAFATVDMYCVATDSWEYHSFQPPKLNKSRFCHSSCEMPGGIIYTFCGMNGTDCLHEVEKFDARRFVNEGDFGANWVLLDLFERYGYFARRHSPLVAQFDHDKVLILGGSDRHGQLSDGFVFDTREESFEQVVLHDHERQFKF